MQRLGGLHIVVGVAGSVAAYRAADVVRDLRALGASVRVAPTRGAQAFVTPLLFEALSGQPCLTTSLDIDHGRIPHVEEAYRAAAVVVAPASADVLAKMAAGFADEAILSLLLSFTCPVLVAPAMETHMWAHPATQQNIETLRRRGVVVVGPVSGPLASGRTGSGRLADVADIVAAVVDAVVAKDLAGVRALVTAGPTAEAIDPVRAITNRSSGKMGLAVAHELALRGAVVDVVHGPLKVPSPRGARTTAIAVTSAQQMADAVFARVDADAYDVAVCAAAVADFTPSSPAAHKIKKGEGPPPLITLVPTVDILKTLGAHARRPRVLVGFAAETQNVEANAEKKRREKNCTFVVGNDVSEAGVGFDVDDNRVYLAGAAPRWLEKMSKADAARAIVDEIAAALRT